MQNLQACFAYAAVVPTLRSMLRVRFQWMSSRLGSQWVAALLACFGTVAVANPPPAMETLFYTPLERQQVERLRLSQTEPAAEATFARVSGVVRRAAGKGTVWINGAPVAEGTPKTGQIRGMDAMVDGKRLRVGESIDKTNGARSDVVEPGAVTVKKNRP